MLVGRAESSVPLFFATVAIAALKKFDVGPAMPAFFRLALTAVAVKSLSPNFPHGPLVIRNRQFQHGVFRDPVTIKFSGDRPLAHNQYTIGQTNQLGHFG